MCGGEISELSARLDLLLARSAAPAEQQGGGQAALGQSLERLMLTLALEQGREARDVEPALPSLPKAGGGG